MRFPLRVIFGRKNGDFSVTTLDDDIVNNSNNNKSNCSPVNCSSLFITVLLSRPFLLANPVI
jgi:hypothetical protein